MTDLTFKTLREVSLTRCNRWHPGGVYDWTLSDWGVAAAGELGEACNVIKKINRLRDKITGNKANELDLISLKLDLAEELADAVISIDLIASRVGLALDQAIIKKFNEVSIREGFSERLEVQHD